MVGEAVLVWELTLRGIAIGALLATAAGLTRTGLRWPLRLAGLLLCLTAGACALDGSGPLRAALPELAVYAVRLLALGAAGCLWLFVAVLFEDRPLSLLTLGPAAGLMLAGVLGWLAPQGGLMGQAVWVLLGLAQAGLASHGGYLIARGWGDDLVEARRRLRGPFLAVVVLFALLCLLEAAAAAGFAPPRADLAGAALLAGFCLGAGGLLLTAREEIFGRPARAGALAGGAEANFDAADRLALRKLGILMDSDQVWRRAGVNGAELAAQVGVAAPRLRRLINDHLGARSFRAFIDARRIAEAQRQLADPAKARTPIAAIAFELGYGSIRPFNAAFREFAGATPARYRRKALGPDAALADDAG